MRTIKQYQHFGILHGAITVLLGLFGGIGLTFVVLGEVSVWPFFRSDWTIPGDPGLWRSAHTGPIMNGVLCIVYTLCLGLPGSSRKSARNIVYAMVFTCWANNIFYFFRIFSVNRGLSVETEKFGSGGIIDAIAYFPPLIAIPVTIYATVLLIILAYRSFRKG